MESNYTNQPYQVTWMAGEFNVTVRGLEKEQVVKDMLAMKSQITKGDVSTFNTPAAPQGNSQKEVTCKKCNSAMRYKSFTSKNGNFIESYVCTNTNCKNDKGYTTSIFASEVK